MPTYAECEAARARKVCVRCDSLPRTVWLGGLTGESAYGLRCNCWPEQPRLVLAEKREERRLREMVNRSLAVTDEKGVTRYESDHGTVALNIRAVKEFINKDVTDMEAELFILVCKTYKLNPFATGEIWLIKYTEAEAAQIQIGKQAYLMRADQDKTYQGHESGVIIETDGEESEARGAVVPEGAVLIGGWCKVYRSNRRVPTYKRVMRAEVQTKRKDGAPNKFWEKSPAMMSEIAAIRQAHREAFPNLFQQMPPDDFDLAQVDVSTGEVIEGTAREAPTTVAEVEDLRDSLFPPQSVDPDPEPGPPSREEESSPETRNQAVDDIQSWLITCPDHTGYLWREMQSSKNPDQKWFSHRTPDDRAWCNRDTLLNQRINADMASSQASLGWDDDAVSAWVSETHGLPLAQLDWPDRLAAVEGLRDVAKQNNPPG